MQSKRILGLDLIRAVAIFLVVFHHGNILFPVPFIPLPDGVDIFFVLSGYLIGGILIKNVEKNGFTLPDLKIFWFRRWFRTLPVFIFVLFVNLSFYFLIVVQNHSIKDTIKQLFLVDKLWQYCLFVQNLFTNIPTGFFQESWSLSVEEWFYILLPLLLIFFLKSGLASYKAILVSIALLIICPTIARYLFSDIHVKGTWMLTRMIVVMRLDGIGCGVLMAYIKYYNPRIWDKLAISKLWLFLGIIVSYGAFYSIHEGYSYFNSITITNIFFYTLTSVGVMLMLPFLSRLTSTDTWFEKMITFVSLISYSMYLINYYLIIGVIQLFYSTGTAKSGQFLPYLVYWVSTIGLAALLYSYIEQPFMKLRDKYYMG